MFNQYVLLIVLEYDFLPKTDHVRSSVGGYMWRLEEVRHIRLGENILAGH